MKAKRLGRGLSGLIKTTEESAAESRSKAAPPANPAAKPAVAAAGAPARVAVDSILPNPYQPRENMDPAGINDLAASIKQHGILQPLVVRVGVTGYELIAGERRLRAARQLGLEDVPVVVRAATDEEMQTLALIENIQRVDLNAIEKAKALRSMMRRMELSHDEVAARVGKARTTIANVLRLLDLPAEVQALVEAGRLGGAHGRAVLRAKGKDRRIKLAARAAEEGWSVREIERRTATAPTPLGKRATPAATENPYVADVVDRIRGALSTKVRMRTKGKGGVIELSYHDAADLDRLLEIFGA